MDIDNATGILNFTSYSAGFEINIYNSPELISLDFPDLQAVERISASGVPGLKRLAVPAIQNRGVVTGHGLSAILDEPSINITEAPQLTEFLTGTYETGVQSLKTLILSSSPASLAGHADHVYVENRLTTLDLLRTDRCLILPSLISVREIYLLGSHRVNGCGYNFSSLPSVRDVNFTDIVNLDFGFPNLVVNGSLNVFPSPPRYLGQPLTIRMGNVTRVGSDATIIGNSDTHLDFSRLDTVAGTLIVSNNTNCTMDFGELSDVGTLSITDNVDTSLSYFLKLAHAENIHLRGHINTSNPFPALEFVSGSVVVEQWNADFNCSRLVAQRDGGIITDLVCTGIEASGTSGNQTSTELSKGAWAGIGVAIGIVVVSLIFLGLLYPLFRKLRRPKAESHQTSADEQVSNQGMQEDHRSLQNMNEMNAELIVQELPEDDVPRPVELAIPAVEMPDRKHNMDIA